MVRHCLKQKQNKNIVQSVCERCCGLGGISQLLELVGPTCFQSGHLRFAGTSEAEGSVFKEK